jgi:branched-chain amino acid transport system permease protein
MLIFIIYTSAWNLLAYSGQGSLGHAAFLGIGGYTTSIIAVKFGLPPLLTVFIGGLAGAAVGFLVGILCVRLREWFLAMVTFGVPVIMTSITVTDIKTIGGSSFIASIINRIIVKISSLQSLFGSHDGLFPPRLVSEASAIEYASILSRISGQNVTKKLGFYLLEYFIILFFTVVFVAFIYFIMCSKWGFAFSAIRNNEKEAKTLGVDTVKYKLAAFVLSAFIAGVAGGLLAHIIRYVNPAIYGIGNSFNPIIYSVVGGLGTIEGPIIGTVVITLLNEYLKNLGLTYLKDVIIGSIIVITLIFLPKGLTSVLSRRGRKSVVERFSKIFNF